MLSTLIMQGAWPHILFGLLFFFFKESAAWSNLSASADKCYKCYCGIPLAGCLTSRPRINAAIAPSRSISRSSR